MTCMDLPEVLSEKFEDCAFIKADGPEDTACMIPNSSFIGPPAICAGDRLPLPTADTSGAGGPFWRPLSPFDAAINNHAAARKVSKRAPNAFRCTHGKYRDSCKQCPGKYFCYIHKSREASSGTGRRKRDCPGCRPTSCCKHGKMRKICKESECLPKAFMLCEHVVRKDSCVICAGCDHGRVKKNCMDCSPHLFCEHGKSKYSCRDHPGPCSHGIKWYKTCAQCPA